MNRATKNKRKKKKNKNKNLNKKIDNNEDTKKIENNEGPKKIENVSPEDNFIKSFDSYTEIYNKLEKISLNFNHIEKEEFEEAESLKFMEKVNEDDLILNYIHYNCFIILQITSKVLSMVSLQFYAEDENNNRMYISVYNYHDKFTINDFNKGNYMIIKEPYYKQYMDFQIGIRVDNPNNILLFKDKDEVYKYISKEKDN